MTISFYKSSYFSIHKCYLVEKVGLSFSVNIFVYKPVIWDQQVRDFAVKSSRNCSKSGIKHIWQRGFARGGGLKYGGYSKFSLRIGLDMGQGIKQGFPGVLKWPYSWTVLRDYFDSCEVVCSYMSSAMQMGFLGEFTWKTTKTRGQLCFHWISSSILLL